MKRMIKMVVFYNDGTYAEITAEKPHKKYKKEKEAKIVEEEVPTPAQEDPVFHNFFNKFNAKN